MSDQPFDELGRFAFLLWPPAPGDADGVLAWLREDAPAALDQAGAGLLQMNLDDADVAAAQLRLSTFEEPVRAAVFATLDPRAVSEVLALLRGHAGRVEGWEVATTEPLVPPAGAAGQRAEGLANVALIRRRADIDDAEFVRRWQGDHTEVAIRTQSTTGYAQHRVVRGLEPGTPVVHAIVEETFPLAAMTDLHEFYGSGGDDEELGRRMREMMESVARFADDSRIDVVPSSRYVFA